MPRGKRKGGAKPPKFVTGGLCSEHSPWVSRAAGRGCKLSDIGRGRGGVVHEHRRALLRQFEAGARVPDEAVWPIPARGARRYGVHPSSSRAALICCPVITSWPCAP